MKIKIIDCVDVLDGEVKCLAKNGKWVTFFERQGTLDGACFVYSLVMCMRCKQLLPMSEDRVRKEYSVLRDFFYKSGMNINGHYTKEMVSKVKNFSNGKLDAEWHQILGKNDTIPLIDYLDKNEPAIITVDWSGKYAGGHALLAIGHEENEVKEITKILCIDPSLPAPQLCAWNAYIELPQKEKGSFPFIHHYKNGKSYCQLKHFVIVNKK